MIAELEATIKGEDNNKDKNKDFKILTSPVGKMLKSAKDDKRGEPIKGGLLGKLIEKIGGGKVEYSPLTGVKPKQIVLPKDMPADDKELIEDFNTLTKKEQQEAFLNPAFKDDLERLKRYLMEK